MAGSVVETEGHRWGGSGMVVHSVVMCWTTAYDYLVGLVPNDVPNHARTGYRRIRGTCPRITGEAVAIARYT